MARATEGSDDRTAGRPDDPTAESAVDGQGRPVRGDFWYSVARSLVTHYWPFSVIVLAFATIGMALAGTFDPVAFVGLLVVIWVTLEGFHAIDLSDPDLTLDVDSRVQRTVGYAQVLLGGALGGWLAARTTWWFVAVVVVATVLGLAYNEEWFDGLFHDRDKLTGLANFGVVWGGLPVLAGYLVLAETLVPGVVFVAIGCTLFAVTLNMLEGPAKGQRYDHLGIRHDRDPDPDADDLARKAHVAQVVNAGTFVCIALGLLMLVGPV